MATAIQTVTVAEAVADELRRRLFAGDYPPGTALRDTELAVEFEAARPTVRAAVQHLVASGLLERGRGRSATVPVFAPGDVVDLYRVRESLELAAVRLVVENAASLTAMEQAVTALRSLPKHASWRRIANAEIEFHRALFATSGSPRLSRAFDLVADEFRLLVAQLRPEGRDPELAAAEHGELLLVLRVGRIRPATAAWRAHLAEARLLVLRLLGDGRVGPSAHADESAHPDGSAHPGSSAQREPSARTPRQQPPDPGEPTVKTRPNRSRRRR